MLVAHNGNSFEKLKSVSCDQFNKAQNKDVSWTDLIVNQAFSSVAVFSINIFSMLLKWKGMENETYKLRY